MTEPNEQARISAYEALEKALESGSLVSINTAMYDAICWLYDEGCMNSADDVKMLFSWLAFGDPTEVLDMVKHTYAPGQE